MAYRILTSKYEKIRSTLKTPHRDGVMDEIYEEDIEDVYPERNEWGELLSGIEKDITDIKKRLNNLKVLHQEHVTIRFGSDYSAEEQQIEIQTKSIKDLFQKCIDTVHRIGGVDDKSQLGKLKTNMKRKLVTQLNDLSDEFKTSQREYIQKLRGIKDKKKQLGIHMYDDGEMEPEDRKKLEELQDRIYSKGFDEAQMALVMQNQRDILERDAELKAILTSVIELKDMFQEFSELIIEQGTILDRIDHNLDVTDANVEEGTVHLVQAEKYQGCGKMMICMIFVVVAFLAVAIVLAIKIGVKILKPF
jgi:syntaxin 16